MFFFLFSFVFYLWVLITLYSGLSQNVRNCPKVRMKNLSRIWNQIFCCSRQRHCWNLPCVKFSSWKLQQFWSYRSKKTCIQRDNTGPISVPLPSYFGGLEMYQYSLWPMNTLVQSVIWFIIHPGSNWIKAKIPRFCAEHVTAGQSEGYLTQSHWLSFNLAGKQKQNVTANLVSHTYWFILQRQILSSSGSHRHAMCKLKYSNA